MTFTDHSGWSYDAPSRSQKGYEMKWPSVHWSTEQISTAPISRRAGFWESGPKQRAEQAQWPLLPFGRSNSSPSRQVRRLRWPPRSHGRPWAPQLLPGLHLRHCHRRCSGPKKSTCTMHPSQAAGRPGHPLHSISICNLRLIHSAGAPIHQSDTCRTRRTLEHRYDNHRPVRHGEGYSSPIENPPSTSELE